MKKRMKATEDKNEGKAQFFNIRKNAFFIMKMKIRQTSDGFLFFNEVLFLFFKRFFNKKFET